jgi:hypothetical protein
MSLLNRFQSFLQQRAENLPEAPISFVTRDRADRFKQEVDQAISRPVQMGANVGRGFSDRFQSFLQRRQAEPMTFQVTPEGQQQVQQLLKTEAPSKVATFRQQPALRQAQEVFGGISVKSPLGIGSARQKGLGSAEVAAKNLYDKYLQERNIDRSQYYNPKNVAAFKKTLPPALQEALKEIDLDVALGTLDATGAPKRTVGRAVKEAVGDVAEQAAKGLVSTIRTKVDDALKRIKPVSKLNTGDEIRLVRGVQKDLTGTGEALFGRGVYLTDNVNVAELYGDEIQEVVVKNSNIFDGNTTEINRFTDDIVDRVQKDTGANIDYLKESEVDYTYNRLRDELTAATGEEPEKIADVINDILKENDFQGVRYNIGQVSDTAVEKGIGDSNAFVLFAEETPVQKFVRDIPKELEPLAKEAMRYDTADDFVNAMQGSSTQYGSYLPEARLAGLEGYERIAKLGIDPEETITIYRGIDDVTGKIPKKINEGDFVTTDFDSALSYASGPENVVSREVKAKDLLVSEPEDFLNDPFYIGSEYVYTTKAEKPLSKSELTNLYNKAKTVDADAVQPKKKTKTGKQQLEEREAAKLARAQAIEKRNALEFGDFELESQYQRFKELVTPGKLGDIEDVAQLKKKVKAGAEEIDNILYSQDKTADEVFNMFVDRRLTEAEPLPQVPKETKAIVAEKARQSVKSAKDIVAKRRELVGSIKSQFNLSDSELKKVSPKDIRLMNNYEFKQYIDGARQMAVELADTRQAKAELMQVIRDQEFKKLDNYRKAKELPSISEMSADEMRDYADALRQFEVGDEFLTQRQLEVVENTDLAGIQTMREARKRLLKELKEVTGRDVKLSEIDNMSATAFDKLEYDSALANKNPFYQLVVERTQKHILDGEARFLQVQQKVDDLARKANASRNRGVVEKAKQALVPRHTEIIQYLEAPVEMKSEMAKQLTKEELDYANFVEQYYADAYDHLIAKKELQGSRFEDQYFTHTRKRFLEKLSDDGVVAAIKNVFDSQKDDLMVSNIIDQDTGKILPKQKFFQYTIRRGDDIDPSQNLTRTFLNYAKTFERKRMFDEMIPEIDIYTHSIAPKDLTDKGLEVDRTLKTFINEYLNNKKGRRTSFGGLVKQNGPVDVAIRLGNMMVSLLDIGLNIGASTAASVGEQVMTYQAMGKIKYAKAWKRRLWDTGLKRAKDKNAAKILKEAEPFIGRNVWTELAEPDTGVGDKIFKGMFGAFSQSSVEANKLFLLGSLTDAEMKAGKLSSDRLAKLKLEAGRWRDMGSDVKSIAGSTSVGEMVTKYKGWAVPIMRTTSADVMSIVRKVKNKEVKEAITSKEAAELYRAIEMSAVVVGLGSYVIGNAEDDSFVGKLKSRVYREAMTFLGGIDPTVFLATPRLLSFAQGLAENLKKIAMLETYDEDSRWGQKGQLKGVKGIQRQITPAAARQFMSNESKTTKDARKYYEQFKDLSPQEARERTAILQAEEPNVYKKMLQIAKEDKLGITKEDKAIKSLKVKNGERAERIYKDLIDMPNSEKEKYYTDLKTKGIISAEVDRQLKYLFQNPDVLK